MANRGPKLGNERDNIILPVNGLVWFRLVEVPKKKLLKRRLAGLHESLQPCSRAARKWRENEEMRRKWRENEEMERD